jgi:glutamate 5-kinase
MDRNTWFKSAQRIVVKVGSNVLTKDNGLNIEFVRAVSLQICRLLESGKEVVLVSSGAMAAGLKKLNLKKRPEEIPMRQAIAAVGQADLIMEYENAFALYGRKVAQILLTGDGLTQRRRYLNARNTLHTLLAWHIVPIINENDTVSVDEIKFGDNDNLSAMIALLLDADILINLTDIDGLYDKDPRQFDDARLIPEIKTIHQEIEQFAGDIPGALGTGGMTAKIRAARKAAAAGIPMIIACGNKTDVLVRLMAGESHGTFFIPEDHKITNRKCWIGFTSQPAGGLIIDDGAVKALLERGKSLLPIGVLDVIGDFEVGSPVECRNLQGNVVGVGLVNYNAGDIRKIKRLKSNEIKRQLGEKPYDEVIHRDNLTVTRQLKCHVDE